MKSRPNGFRGIQARIAGLRRMGLCLSPGRSSISLGLPLTENGEPLASGCSTRDWQRKDSSLQDHPHVALNLPEQQFQFVVCAVHKLAPSRSSATAGCAAVRLGVLLCLCPVVTTWLW